MIKIDYKDWEARLTNFDWRSIAHVSAITLLAGLALTNLLFLFALLVYGYVFRVEIEKSIATSTPVDSVWLPWVVSGLAFVFLLALSPPPTDDLLRHISAWQFNYDYSKVYAETDVFPKINLWFGYELIAGQLAQWLGQDIAFRLIQAVCIGANVLVISLVMGKLLKDHGNRYLLVTAGICTLFIVGSISRFGLGRPEMFLTPLIFSSVLLSPVAWLTLILVLSPCYWLTPMFAMGAVLLDTSWRNRFLFGALAGFGSAAVLWLFMGNEWWNTLHMVGIWNDVRVGSISELKGLGTAILRPEPLATLLLSVWLLARSPRQITDKWVGGALLIMLICAGFNYARYFAIFHMANLVVIARIMPREWYLSNRLVMLGLSFMMAIWMIVHVPNGHPRTTQFHLPAGSKMLGTMALNYEMLSFGNSSSQFVPGFDIAIHHKEDQEAAAGLEMGRVDCDYLRSHKYTHVGEKSLDAIPDCLSLIEVSKEYRLWRVTPSAD